MSQFVTFPELNRKNISFLKVLIGVLVIFTMVLFAGENIESVKAIMGENYADSLPIYSVDTEEKVVSLTFDAAWGDEDLDEILSILDEHNCKATFFVTGDWATRYPDAIEKIYKQGHDLGNHGANHKHMTTLGQNDMIKEIEDCHNIVKAMTGVDMNLFRAPYGDYNENVVLTAALCEYYTIQWDVDSLDWKDYGVESIINTVCRHKNLQNGSIILLHNGSTYTAQALDGLLNGLENQGYSFVPVSELIYKDEYSIDHTGRQYK